MKKYDEGLNTNILGFSPTASVTSKSEIISLNTNILGFSR